MTTLATLEGLVTVTADAWPSLLGHVEVTDDDAFYIDVIVDERAAVAFAQRFQQLGVKLEIARPDGVLVVVPDRHVTNSITIEESADLFGDRLTVRISGTQYSPSARATLRARNRIRMQIVTGSGIHEHRAIVFNGHTVQGVYDIQPPAGTITALDGAGLYAQRKAKTYTVAPNSRKSRLLVGREMLAAGGIPAGAMDLPNGDGGRITKPVAPGDRPIVDFLRDFYAILGCEVGFIDNVFVVTRYDASRSPVLEINPSNLIVPATISLPETLRPNVTGVVSVRITRTEPSDQGLKTVRLSVTTVGTYAPQQWATQQIIIGGEPVINTNLSSGTPTPRVISEVITDTTYLGSLDVRTEQEEHAFYSARGSASRIAEIEDPPGYELQPVDAYAYADGSTRVDRIEPYQTTRRMIRTKQLDGFNVVGIREERYFFRFHRLALWQVVFDPETGISETVLNDLARINDDGDGVVGGREALGRYGPDEITETAFTLNDDGTIREELVTERFHDIGAKRPRAANAFGYGVDPRTYTSRAAEAIGPNYAHAGIRTTSKRYRVITEDRYEVMQIVRNGSEAPVITTTSMQGALPRPERVEPEQTSQEIRAEVVDTMRVQLVGEEIEDVQHNEFIETDAEAAAYARHLARRAAAFELACDIPLEGLVHKWKTVSVNLPGASIHGLKFYVRQVRRDIATYRESIVAEHYPPELA